MSSAQLISAPSLQAKLGPSGPQATELFQFWSGSSGPTWNVPDVKPFSQAPFSMSLTPPATDLPGESSDPPIPAVFSPLTLFLMPAGGIPSPFCQLGTTKWSKAKSKVVEAKRGGKKGEERKGGFRPGWIQQLSVNTISIYLFSSMSTSCPCRLCPHRGGLHSGLWNPYMDR